MKKKERMKERERDRDREREGKIRLEACFSMPQRCRILP